MLIIQNGGEHTKMKEGKLATAQCFVQNSETKTRTFLTFQREFLKVFIWKEKREVLNSKTDREIQKIYSESAGHPQAIAVLWKDSAPHG